MTHTIEVPDELIRCLVQIKEVTGKPVYSQITTSLKLWIEKHRREGVIA